GSALAGRAAGAGVADARNSAFVAGSISTVFDGSATAGRAAGCAARCCWAITSEALTASKARQASKATRFDCFHTFIGTLLSSVGVADDQARQSVPSPHDLRQFYLRRRSIVVTRW